jgi:hypothetical protein
MGTIKMEFTCGENIEKAFSEAIRIAKILNVWIEFDFNGINCLANSNGSVENGITSYRNELKKKGDSLTAFA